MLGKIAYSYCLCRIRGSGDLLFSGRTKSQVFNANFTSAADLDRLFSWGILPDSLVRDQDILVRDQVLATPNRTSRLWNWDKFANRWLLTLLYRFNKASNINTLTWGAVAKLIANSQISLGDLVSFLPFVLEHQVLPVSICSLVMITHFQQVIKYTFL